MISIPFHKLFRGTECQSALLKCDLENIDYKKVIQESLNALGYKYSLITDSCTRALEIVAQIIDFQKEDEVIIPSYGYVTTASIFHQAGAKIVFADASNTHPNMSLVEIEQKISPKTKAIVVINYGGFNSHLQVISELCKSKGIILIEDNAHGIGAKNAGKPLGTFGDLSALSFHHTKNIHCFSGGALIINNEHFLKKAENYYYKGTDKQDFQQGKVTYYQWIGLGNACELSNLSAAYLSIQMKLLDQVNNKRNEIWRQYKDKLKSTPLLEIVSEVDADIKSSTNAHIFPLVFASKEEKDKVQLNLKRKGISAYSHYNALHNSVYGRQLNNETDLQNSERFTDCLLRLPIYPNLKEEEIDYITDTVNKSVFQEY